MSELNRARSQLSSTRTLLKQKKLLAAVIAVHDALSTFLKLQPSLFKSEREDFQQLLEKNIHLLHSDENLRQIYPLVLTYAEGQERTLLEQIKTILDELQGSAVEDAKQQLVEMEYARQTLMDNGLGQLNQGNSAGARKIFDQLIAENADDTGLKLDISDEFLKKGDENAAEHYLKQAAQDNPESVHIFNRMGMILRKLRRFEHAESVFLKALEKSKDEYLYFNLGRVYIDFGRWQQAATAAQSALDINPDFKEARQMLGYVQKKMAN